MTNHPEIRIPLADLARALVLDPQKLHMRALAKYKALKALGALPHTKGATKQDRLFLLNEAQALYLAEGKHRKRIVQAFAKKRLAQAQWLKVSPYGGEMWEVIGIVPMSTAMDFLKRIYP
jgi:predicted component of type VI protein secretion system